MCVVCIELMKNKLNLLEAQRALTELIMTSTDDKETEHYMEMYDAVVKDLMEVE